MADTSDIVWFGGLLVLAVVATSQSFADWVATLPALVKHGVVAVLLLIVVLDFLFEAIESIVHVLASLITFTYSVKGVFTQLSFWPTVAGFGELLAVVVAVCLWFVSVITLLGLIIAIFDVDPDVEESGTAEQPSDDPFGDEHAARILNQESN